MRWAVIAAAVIVHFIVVGPARFVDARLQVLGVGLFVAAIQAWWGPAPLPLSLGRVRVSLRLAAKVVVVGLAVAVVCFFGLVVVARLTGMRWDLSLVNLTTRSQFRDWIILGVVWAPLIEEIGYRGFLQARLVEVTGRLRALLISALVFWVYHWIALGVISLHHLGAGLLLGWVYDRTRSLLAPILIHATLNILIITYSYGAVAYRPELEQLFGW